MRREGLSSEPSRKLEATLISQLINYFPQASFDLGFRTEGLPVSQTSKLMDIAEQNITLLPTSALPVIPQVDSYEDHRGRFTPLIIDNGSTTLRFGFATSSSPHTGTNVIAKYKERKNNRPLLLFADGVEAESGAKGQARTPWEGDVLLNFDALVCVSIQSACCIIIFPFFDIET